MKRGVRECLVWPRAKSWCRKLVNFSVGVIAIAAESSNAEDFTQDEPCENTLWVGRVWGEVEVEIEILFVDGRMEPVVGDANGEIHEVGFLRAIREFPFEAMVSLPGSLKFVPIVQVDYWIRIVQPNPNDVINEALV
jgi:hypothetical protein